MKNRCQAEKKKLKQKEYEETKKMRKSDYEACLIEELGAFHAAGSSGGVALAGKAFGVAPKGSAEQKFQNGQSILQWWASWFAAVGLEKPLEHYNKKNRPQWFSGEVLSYSGWGAITYAGVPQAPGHCYSVY